jgi:hypothetical protein
MGDPDRFSRRCQIAAAWQYAGASGIDMGVGRCSRDGKDLEGFLSYGFLSDGFLSGGWKDGKEEQGDAEPTVADVFQSMISIHGRKLTQDRFSQVAADRFLQFDNLGYAGISSAWGDDPKKSE